MKNKTIAKKQNLFFISIFSAILCLLLLYVLSLSIGAASLKKGEISREIFRAIILEQRLPRTLFSSLIGALLALAGAAFQGLFYNSLADPYILGTSSGAGLGAVFALVCGIPAFGPIPSVAVFSVLAALAASITVFILAQRIAKPAPISALLLSGLALSALFSSLLSLLLILKDRDLHRLYFWLMGGFSHTWFSDFYYILPLAVLALILILPQASSLDLLGAGEDLALGTGLSLFHLQFSLIIGVSLIVGASVAVSGIIGFVGLIAPHIARLIVGPLHRRLFPLAALLGAILTLSADILSRLIIPPAELPVGLLTSLLGAPFFLFLLYKSISSKEGGV